ncbi:MAG: hypothetical protein Q9197_003715 [Variospora fuerteventurae]
MVDSKVLLQLLAETLRSFEGIEILMGFTQEHEVAYAKFSVQRTRLVLWGLCMDNQKAQDDSSVTEQAAKMRALYDVSHASKSSTELYGLRISSESTSQTSRQSPYRASARSRGFELFKRTFDTYTRRLSGRIGCAMSVQSRRLCVTDLSLFSTFVKDLERCLDDLYGPTHNERNIQNTRRWRDHFYEAMSTIAEEPDSLSLLAEASSGHHDTFGNFASQRLLEREGRPLPTIWKGYQTFEADLQRLKFTFWHTLLHRLVPIRLQGGSDEPPTSAHSTTASHPAKPSGTSQGYLALCSRFGRFNSNIAEVDLSTIKSNLELSTEIHGIRPQLWPNEGSCSIRRVLVRAASVRLIQFKIENGRTMVLARDSLPTSAEIEGNRYATADLAKKQQASSPSAEESVMKKTVDEDKEMQAVHSVSDIGRRIHDRVFGKMQTDDSADVLELLPKNLGPSLLSEDCDTSIGWGIEIVEGPSWIFNCLQLVPTGVVLMILKVTYAILTKDLTRVPAQSVSDQVRDPNLYSGKPAIDVYLIAVGFLLLIFVLVKGSRMLEARR